MSRTISTRAAEVIADVAVLVLLALFVIVYALDSVRASTDVLNLILVLPVSVIVLVLCAAQFVLSIVAIRRASRARSAHEESETAGVHEHENDLPIRDSPRRESPRRDSANETGAGDVARVVGLFALYVLTLPWLGFDIGTAIFIAIFIWLQGERRWPWLLGYSIAFAFALSFTFSRLLPYDMPLSVLGAG